MASYTEQYRLKKPAPEDVIDIADLNENADKIEEALTGKAEREELEEATKTIKAEKGQPNGVATLDEDGKVPAAQIPDPDKIGAAKESHGHIVKDISDFPTKMKPTAHASTHAADGADPLTPGDIGAAKEGHNHVWGQVTGKPDAYPPSAHNHAWSNITGKPSAFPPASHGHSVSDVTGAATPVGPMIVTLYASQWSGTGPWIQTAVCAVTPWDEHLHVYPIPVADNTAREAYEQAYKCLDVTAAAQTGGICFVCRTTKPTTDIKVIVEGVRKEIPPAVGDLQPEAPEPPDNWYETANFYGVTVVPLGTTSTATTKPSGGYTGNGSATRRTIATGGTGNVLFWMSHKDSTFGFVFCSGAVIFSLSGNPIEYFKSSEIRFQEGDLTIETASTKLNKYGVYYNCQVL